MAKPKTDHEGYELVTRQVPAPELARLLGITRQAVHKWGGVVPERFVLRVSTITNIPPENILPEVVKEMRKKIASRDARP